MMSLVCLSKTLGKTQGVVVCETTASDWQLTADTVSASFKIISLWLIFYSLIKYYKNTSKYYIMKSLSVNNGPWAQLFWYPHYFRLPLYFTLLFLRTAESNTDKQEGPRLLTPWHNWNKMGRGQPTGQTWECPQSSD